MTSDTPHRPFTQAWADSFRIAINDDADYRAAAKGWRWPMALILDPATTLGYPEAVAVRLDLEEGICREARIVVPAEADAPFTLRGPYPVWKRIVLGELDAIAAVVKQELDLEGRLGILVKHAKSARALVNCARRVPTRFPDEE